MESNPVFIIFGCLWILVNLLETEAVNWRNEEFDFIVVGGGSAGSVIAARLSEIPEVSVLLLEAGDEPTQDTEVPLFAVSHWDSPGVNWRLQTEKQKNACLSYTDQKCPWPHAQMLGGSSGLNAMVFTRGNKNDFDLWDALGNDGWSYEEVLPYFLKMENYEAAHSKYDSPYHSEDGLITISRPPYRTPLASAFLEAGREMGYYEVDYNGELQKGFMTPVFNIKNGIRFGTYKAYLERNRNRPNLVIETAALVLKVIIENQEAKGVQYEKEGTTWQVKAKKEVILSTGTTFSPQLLMLSGIGPKKTLEKFGIPAVKELAGVGQSLQDNVIINGLSFTLEEPVGINVKRDINEDSMQLYQRKKLGVMTVPMAVEGVSFMDSSLAQKTVDYPDLELLFTSTAAMSLGLTDEAMKLINPPTSKDYFTVYPILQRPYTRGYITLRSTDAHDPPIIEPLYLTEEDDVKIMLDGIKAVFDLVNTTAFQRFGAKYHNNKIPDCKTLEGDEYWICFIKHFSVGLFHFTGTCKMGADWNNMAVVDHELKVHGVDRLRIADASVIPGAFTGHTNAPTIMIGEKAADLIKKHWNLKHLHTEL